MRTNEFIEISMQSNEFMDAGLLSCEDKVTQSAIEVLEELRSRIQGNIKSLLVETKITKTNT